MHDPAPHDPPADSDVTARTRFVAAAVLVVTTAFILAKTGRDALFFSGGGIFDLPRATLGIAALSLPMAGVALGLMRGLGPRRARVVAPLMLAAGLVAFARIARPGGGVAMTAFFMVVTLAFGVLFSMTWLLAADLLEGAARERLARSYGTIGAASILGGTLGGLIGRGLAPHVEPRVLVLLGAAMLVVAAGIVVVAQRRFPIRASGPAAAMVWSPQGISDVLRQPYTRRMLAVAMLSSVVGVLIEFQFYLAAAASGASTRHTAGFFANAYLLLNLTAFAVQVLALPRLQKVLGVGGALLVLPGALLGGGVALLVTASAAMRAVMRITEGGLKSSIHRTLWEQAFLPYGRARRSVAKLLVDGGAARIAEGIAAAGLLLWVRSRPDMLRLTRENGMLLALTIVLLVASWLGVTFGWSRRAARLQASTPDADALAVMVPVPDS